MFFRLPWPTKTFRRNYLLTVSGIAILKELFALQMVRNRISNWRSALKRQDWEVQRHHERQAEAVISLELQQRFMEVREVKCVRSRLGSCIPPQMCVLLFLAPHEWFSFQSELLANVINSEPVEPVLKPTARDVRDVLMTTLVVGCAGRPSHVTGIKVQAVLQAKVQFYNHVDVIVLVASTILTFCMV